MRQIDPVSLFHVADAAISYVTSRASPVVYQSRIAWLCVKKPHSDRGRLLRRATLANCLIIDELPIIGRLALLGRGTGSGPRSGSIGAMAVLLWVGEVQRKAQPGYDIRAKVS